MSNTSPKSDDEIDLFEVFDALWDGKWMVGGFVVLAAVVGFLFPRIASLNYSVTAPYTFNFYTVASLQTCAHNVGCIESELIKRIAAEVNDEWDLAQRPLAMSQSTPDPLALQEYHLMLESVNQRLTSNAYNEALTEVMLIQSELGGALSTTEIAATNLLNARRVIENVEGGRSLIDFGPVDIDEPKASRILFLCVVLGLFVGVFFVLVRKAARERKERQIGA